MLVFTCESSYCFSAS